MNTIHDGGAGSELARMRTALIRERRARGLLGRTKDALEEILGAGCIGFCRILAGRARLTANPHFKALFGWPPDAVLERRDLDARVHPDDRAALACALTAALEEGAPLDLTVRAVWPNAITQYIALRGRCELADPEVRGGGTAPRKIRAFVLVATNVSAEHKALQDSEAALARECAARARVEAVNRSNLELLATVSHELRSPLNAVLGWNRLLAIKRDNDSEVKGHTTRIEHSAKAQLRILNDLLDFGRMGTGKFQITTRPMKLAAVATAAVEAASAAARAKDIELTADFASTAGELTGDAERLRQVVTSLLSNAVKFTPVRGKIHVCLRRAANELILIVTDTGVGIAPERLAQIFQPARARDASGAQGLGIGLALARTIVALHGGSVQVTSAGVDRGVRVEVRLPATAEASVDAEPPVPSPVMRAPRALSGLVILVVDDEPETRTVVAELLRLEGAEVAVCDSAACAYEKLCAQGSGFDVVVTDIGMPVEDGYSLVRKLRALPSGTRVLAIALTGYATPSDAAAALAAGFDLHVPKPVDFERFIPLIRRLSTHT